MSRILSSRNLTNSPGSMPSTSSVLPKKLSFQCHDDENGRRPSTPELYSSTEMSAEEDTSGLVDGENVEDEDEPRAQDDDEFSDIEPKSPQSSSVPNRNQSNDTSDNKRSSWADMDFSVMVALASPIGSWLFGHDHLKNFIVVLLLIFYLHQLIEVPWRLYLSARPRRPAPNYPIARSADSHQVLLAQSELRRWELIYLSVTLLSPFTGAYLFSKVVATVTGEPMPWFSTNLFVLATAVRPWTHLVSRLRERSRDLQDVIHYPSPEHQLIADGQLQAIQKRMERLEGELKKAKRVMAIDQSVAEAHKEMLDALDDVERVMKRQERKAESTKNNTESRLAEMEATITRLQSENNRLHLSRSDPGALVRQIVLDLLDIPHALWTSVAMCHFRSVSSSFQGSQQSNPIPGHPASSNHTHLSSIRRTSRLETIPEYGDENVVFVTASGPKSAKRRRSIRQSELPYEKRIAVSPIEFAVQAMLIPYRLSVRLLIAILPPLQKFFS